MAGEHPSFEALEFETAQFARGLTERGICPSCVARALAYTGMDLAIDAGALPQWRDTLQSLLDAIEQEVDEGGRALTK
jgi:hypothetical protein